ncbi:MAG: Rrf2 family transcriptional regulator [Halofilum sp. (in: g-proteobacteria)]
MKLTTRGRYAVTAMLDLALHEGDGPVALGEIASRQDISLSYLEQLFSRLRRQGLVTSTRGPGGGYRLSRPADAISVAHVVDAVAERVEYTRCGGERNCQNHERCLTHDLWQSLGDHVRSFLDEATLASLMERPAIREVAARQDAAPVFWRDTGASGSH